MKLFVENVTNDVGGKKTLSESTDKKGDVFLEGIFLQANVENRNGRIYPLDIMKREVARYTKEYIKTKRAFGELEHPCYDKDARCVTATGIKKIADVVVGEKVFSVDPTTNKLVVDNVIEVHKNRYCGKMIHFYNNVVDFKVTPYHTMLIDNNGVIEKISAQDLYNAIITKDVMFVNKSLCTAARVSDNVLTTIVLDKVKRCRQPNYRENLEIDVLGFAELIAMLLDNAKVKAKVVTNCIKFKIANKFGELIERFKVVIGKLGIDFKIINHKAKTEFVILDRRIVQALTSVINDKVIEQKIVDKLHRQGCNKIIATIFETHNIDQIYEDQTIQCLAEIAIKGCVAISFKANKILPLFDKVWINQINVDKIDYNDYVYCLTTENTHTFINYDDNNTIVYTGNCNPQINLDRVSHIITDLWQDGNYFRGKAKILDTPCGRIVKAMIKEGCTLGVSSRALGSTVKNEDGVDVVQDDFRLVTAGDIVFDPSAQKAFPKGIVVEDIEWEYDPVKDEYIAKNEKELIKRAKKSHKTKALQESAQRRVKSKIANLKSFLDTLTA